MPLNRRTFLRGLAMGAGAQALQPIAMQLLAHAQGIMPGKRIIFVIESNCLNEEHVIPQMAVDAMARLAPGATAQGKTYNVDAPLIVEGINATGALALEPLADKLSQAAIINGLSNQLAGGGHSCDFGLLSSAPSTKFYAGGITIDRYLGKHIAGQTPYSQLALGMVATAVGETPPALTYTTTAAARNNPSPIMTNPVSARRSLFGSVTNSAQIKAFDQQVELLDFLVEDVTQLQRNLAAPEQEKLEHYLNSMSSLRDRHAKIKAIETPLNANLPPELDIYTSIHPIHRLEASFELATASLISGMTNVMLLTSSTGSAHFGLQFSSLGDEFPSKHGLGHLEPFMGRDAREWLGELSKMHTSLVATMIQRLEGVPEGDGTMWDNTLVVFTNDGGNEHHNRAESWPIMLLGGKNIPLNLDGRCIMYPKMGNTGHRHFNAVWNTVCHAMGAPTDNFGDEKDPKGLEILPELMS